MIHTRTKIIAGVSTLILVLSALGLFGMLYTLYLFHEELHMEARAVSAAVIKEQQLMAMERAVEETQAERAEISALVLTEDRVVDFLAIIEGIGSDLGLTSKTNSLTVISGKTDIEEVSMSVSLEGPEESVRYALRLLETLPYRSSLERVTLSQGGDGEVLWTMTVELRVAKYKNS